GLASGTRKWKIERPRTMFVRSWTWVLLTHPSCRCSRSKHCVAGPMVPKWRLASAPQCPSTQLPAQGNEPVSQRCCGRDRTRARWPRSFGVHARLRDNLHRCCPDAYIAAADGTGLGAQRCKRSDHGHPAETLVLAASTSAWTALTGRADKARSASAAYQ